MKLQFFQDSILFQSSRMRLKHKENQSKYRKMTSKRRSHVKILIYLDQSSFLTFPESLLRCRFSPP